MLLLLCLLLAAGTCSANVQQALFEPSDIEEPSGIEAGPGFVSKERVQLLSLQTPVDGVIIHPDDDVQAIIGAHPAGSTFVFSEGIHRLTQPITPRDGDSFIGEAGAVISGARLLAEFSREGSLWVAGSQTQQGMVHGNCREDSPRCDHPEDLFIDDTPLKHVSSLEEVQEGTWFFDYDADKIYFADDPSGRRVETSVVDGAFVGEANNVTIQNLVIEKFANRAQYGAVHSGDGENWHIEGNEVRLNHGTGIKVGHGARILNNHVHNNGQLGVGSLGGGGTLIEGNEIAHNNYAGYDPAWEAGGTKFVRTEALVVRKNHVHRNDGPGLWTDIDNLGTLYEYNLVEHNLGDGIFHEISYDAVIRHNTIRYNGYGQGYDSYQHNFGAGINIYNSANVEVYSNTVLGNWNGITARHDSSRVDGGAHGPRNLSNLHVHSNTIELLYHPYGIGPTGARGVSSYVGIVGTSSSPAFTPEANNRFESNTYIAVGERHWRWAGSGRTFAEWQALGQDQDGAIIHSASD